MNRLKAYHLITCAANLVLFVGGVFAFPQLSNAQWVYTDGLEGMKVYALAACKTKLVAGTSNGVFSSVDGGASWIAASEGLPLDTWVVCFLASGRRLLAGTSHGLFISPADSSTFVWSRIDMPIQDREWIHSLAASGSRIFAGASSGVLSSDDGAVSWNKLNAAVTQYIVDALFVWKKKILAAIDEYGLYRSTDNGRSWKETQGLPKDNKYFPSIAKHGKFYFIGTPAGVFRSDNEGMSWKEMSNGLPEGTLARSFARAGRNLFAGTEYGVFVSANNVASWEEVNSGLPAETDVWSLVATATHLLAGTDGQGVWRLSLAGLPLRKRAI